MVIASDSRHRHSLRLPSHDTVSEWLRRWTRNPLGSAREGSNPFGVAFLFIFLRGYPATTTLERSREPSRSLLRSVFAFSEEKCFPCDVLLLPCPRELDRTTQKQPAVEKQSPSPIDNCARQWSVSQQLHCHHFPQVTTYVATLQLHG